jgi:hypothetical protein
MYSNKYKKDSGEKVASLLNISDRNKGNVTVVFLLPTEWSSRAWGALLVAKDCSQHVTSAIPEKKVLDVSSHKVDFPYKKFTESCNSGTTIR